MNEIKGLNTSTLISIQLTSSRISCPYTVKISSPLSETALNTRPRMPNGANSMTHLTASVTTSENSETTLIAAWLPVAFRAIPRMADQKRMPM